MNNTFFAMFSRMKYINRWQLMRNTRNENLSEHSHFVSAIAHALVMLHNQYYEGKLNADRAAVLGIYHDMPEIITGDMPTPVKYFSKEMREAYHVVEQNASEKLIDMLSEDLKAEYSAYFHQKEEDKELWRFVKAADKMSALVKCIEEEQAGNTEFSSAKKSIEETLRQMNMPAVDLFMTKFMPAFKGTLDEQSTKA